MKILTLQQYDKLRENAVALTEDSLGEKVLQLKDNTILKLFRCKHILSSAFLFPYSIRFANNVKRLTSLGVSTISVIDLWRIPSIKRTAVHYQPLKGETVRDCLLRHAADQQKRYSISKLACFIEKLHSQGIYFRSLHCGNIIETHAGEHGLIDVHDMKFYRKPLSVRLRLRNLHHFTRYREDVALLSKESTEQFIETYCRQSAPFICSRKKINALFFPGK